MFSLVFPTFWFFVFVFPTSCLWSSQRPLSLTLVHIIKWHPWFARCCLGNKHYWVVLADVEVSKIDELVRSPFIGYRRLFSKLTQLSSGASFSPLQHRNERLLYGQLFSRRLFAVIDKQLNCMKIFGVRPALRIKTIWSEATTRPMMLANY